MLLHRQPHGDLVHRESCICSVGMSDSSTWLLRSWSRKSAILVVYFEGGKAPTLFSGLGNAFFFFCGWREIGEVPAAYLSAGGTQGWTQAQLPGHSGMSHRCGQPGLAVGFSVT